jgi:hypothetical protein
VTAQVIFIDKDGNELSRYALGPNDELRIRLDLNDPAVEALSGEHRPLGGGRCVCGQPVHT